MIGTVVVIAAALAAGSVALAGFGLDSLIEIGASTIVIWQLKDTTGTREQRALRLIGIAFIALAVYIAGQAAYTLIADSSPAPLLGRDRVDRGDLRSDARPRCRQSPDRPRARRIAFCRPKDA